MMSRENEKCDKKLMDARIFFFFSFFYVLIIINCYWSRFVVGHFHLVVSPCYIITKYSLFAYGSANDDETWFKNAMPPKI